ncbi:hypothetical protein BBJ29_000551 [Phytophthora kernoviae]|uniref:Uncharacterized protein n=1 Tax=Phytophthora kernoviae TaxID=325452 RepID=A0A3F2S2Q5_9STRA|nr:hypothetical protein BBJ29_000551 [Phytophthora kernoviae]RLN68625.1 hypothetical protein BBP00_00000888 [Phytophthora kernoviae]
MSVESVEGVFCVAGEVCMATFSAGSCPSAQEGLPYGSYCGIVASGVYGCKTSIDPATTSETPSATPVVTSADTTEPETAEPPTDAPVTVAPSVECSEGSLTVSVQGLKNAYCVIEPACVSDISSGNCPGSQSGLHIVGSELAFCAPEPVCSGINYGNCPEIQDGLVQSSDCMIIDTGVYGCVFMAST